MVTPPLPPLPAAELLCSSLSFVVHPLEMNLFPPMPADILLPPWTAGIQQAVEQTNNNVIVAIMKTSHMQPAAADKEIHRPKEAQTARHGRLEKIIMY